MSNITLTAALRANLLSLQGTQKNLDTVQLRLATGKKVNSALDNANAFFASQSLNFRAKDLGNLLSGIGQSIQVLKAADTGITALTTLVEQMQAVANSANERAVGANVADLATQYTNLGTQIDQLITDTGYRGTNLLNGNNLVTRFNETGTSTLTTTAVTYTRANLGLGTGANVFGAAGLKVQATLDAQITALSTALTTLRNQASTFGNDLNVIQARESFTQSLVNVLKEGSDKLTLADKNEEGANLLSLQTAQQLGIQALSLASQANQSVLRLFG